MIIITSKGDFTINTGRESLNVNDTVLIKKDREMLKIKIVNKIFNVAYDGSGDNLYYSQMVGFEGKIETLAENGVKLYS